MSITGRDVPVVVGAPVRSTGLDALRGLAVLLMVSDHVALLLGADWWRLTVGRLAMPIFMVLAGHLCRRFSWRHGWVLAVGLALPFVVPWIDSPNILVWYVVGAGLLAACRWAEVSPWVLVIVALTIAANGWIPQGRPTYELGALAGLMAVGALLPRAAFSAADRLPASVLAPVGRFPLTVYVAHLVLLELVRVSA